MPDRKGPGGTLSLSPYHDAGEIDEIWNPGDYMDDLVEVRGQLVAGDFVRCMPSGSVLRSTINPSSRRLSNRPCREAWRTAWTPSARCWDFFGLDPLILAAASEGSPSGPQRRSHEEQCREWVERAE